MKRKKKEDIPAAVMIEMTKGLEMPALWKNVVP